VNRIPQKLLLCLLLLGSHAPASPVQEWFRQGNDFYDRQNYDSASACYEKIIASGVLNPDLFYNLGNTYYRKGKIGMAILFYEKAHALAPSDEDIRANLRFANANIVDRIDIPEPGFMGFIFNGFHGLFPLGTQLWIILSLLLVLSLSVAGILFCGGIARLWLIYLSGIVLLCTVPLAISAGVKIFRAETSPHAIVLEKVVDAKNGPDGHKILFTIHEGTKFRVLKELQGWSLISLANGVSGWIPNSVLGII
jgi:tetratricopeptide (TPR) repeat protein